jgi:tRNA (cmo5U34)-methyltransferase
MSITEIIPGWDEADSREFIDSGRLFVPDREEQIATVLDLIPEIPEPGEGLLVDLCCGAGPLTAALLERFPRARVLAMDLSPTMLEHVRSTLDDVPGVGDRLQTRQFDLADTSWRSFPEPVHAFVSSLAIHHLDGEGKRQLFCDLAAALAPGGAVVIADLVRPASPAGQALAAKAWDEAVRRRSQEIAGDLAPYKIFQEERWNFYADPDPDPIDQPSPLINQLQWLAEAGLIGVEVHWLKAGHAIFGGFRPG